MNFAQFRKLRFRRLINGQLRESVDVFRYSKLVLQAHVERVFADCLDLRDVLLSHINFLLNFCQFILRFLDTAM